MMYNSVNRKSVVRECVIVFIGRERELNKLNELYHAGNFQFPVIYGRRCVGKTSLINEFIKSKGI